MDKNISNIQLGRQFSETQLPEGCTYTPTVLNGKKEGQVTVFSKDSLLYAILNFHEDRLEGICEYYDKGLLKEKITYKNGVPDGWGCLYENSKESKWFIYKNGSKYSEIIKDGEYYTEREIRSNSILSICKYNENHNREGLGYLYQDGKVSKAVLFSNGEQGKTIKKFEGKVMTELNDNGDEIYKGEYLNDRQQNYPRNGQGKEYEEGKIVYDGFWKKNKKEGQGSSYKSGRALYVGEWSQNMPNGQGKLYGENGVLLHDGNWKKGVLLSKKGVIMYSSGGVKKKATLDKEKVLRLKKKMNTKENRRILFWILIALFVVVCAFAIYGIYELAITHTVRNRAEFEKLSKNVKRLKIPSNSCNDVDFTEFHLSDFTKLRSVIVGKNSCQNVESVMLSDLPSLSTLEFGMNSFTKAVNSFAKNGSRSFSISNCEKLSSISFDRFSFSDYSVFNLKALNDLKTLEFGDIVKDSYNFHYASIDLVGTIK